MERAPRAATPQTSKRMFFHPQRGVVLTDRPLRPGWCRYRGGSDGDWKEMGSVPTSIGVDGLERVVDGRSLPHGFVVGEPSKQSFGMGGPLLVLAPLERTCRTCGEDFVFTGAEQKHWYETLGFFIDATAVHCARCRSKRHRLEGLRRAWADALKKAESAPSLETHLAVVRAALALLEAGGKVAVTKAWTHCRRARRLGSRGKADALRERLLTFTG